MKSYIKKISFLLSLLLVFNFSIVFADNSIEFKSDIVTHENHAEITPYAVGEVAIFIAGILAGFIVDGVVIAVSGQSSGEWIARALTFHRRNPDVKNIHFETPNGHPHSGSRGKFSLGF